jgi:hypothetical protein
VKATWNIPRILPVRAERLEPRALLAGDVVAFLDGSGNLIVIGDGAANGIDLDLFGGFTVAGTDAGGSPTRVNGEPNGTATFTVTGEGDIRLFLGGGDDLLEVGTRSDSVDTPDDLEIYGGSGDDDVRVIGDTNVGDDLEVRAGSGDDVVRIYSPDVADDLDVSTEGGDDAVTLYGANVGDDLLVRTGAGRDTVDVGFSDEFESRIFGAVTVAEDTLIDLGIGDDALEVLDSTFEGRFFADGGWGTDTLIQSGNTFARRPIFVRFERR